MGGHFLWNADFHGISGNGITVAYCMFPPKPTAKVVQRMAANS